MSYKQTFLQFPCLGQSVDGSPLIRADLAVELAGDADKEIAALRAENAQLREELAAQSRTLDEKTQQVESLRAELSELSDAGIEKVLGLETSLADCVEPLLTLIDHPVCDECLVCKALENARRVLGKKGGA